MNIIEKQKLFESVIHHHDNMFKKTEDGERYYYQGIQSEFNSFCLGIALNESGGRFLSVNGLTNTSKIFYDFNKAKSWLVDWIKDNKELFTKENKHELKILTPSGQNLFIYNK